VRQCHEIVTVDVVLRYRLWHSCYCAPLIFLRGLYFRLTEIRFKGLHIPTLTQICCKIIADIYLETTVGNAKKWNFTKVREPRKKSNFRDKDHTHKVTWAFCISTVLCVRTSRTSYWDSPSHLSILKAFWGLCAHPVLHIPYWIKGRYVEKYSEISITSIDTIHHFINITSTKYWPRWDLLFPNNSSMISSHISTVCLHVSILEAWNLYPI
jgi:hypothetical protein